MRFTVSGADATTGADSSIEVDAVDAAEAAAKANAAGLFINNIKRSEVPLPAGFPAPIVRLPPPLPASSKERHYFPHNLNLDSKTSSILAQLLSLWSKLTARQRRRVVMVFVSTLILLPALAIWMHVKDGGSSSPESHSGLRDTDFNQVQRYDLPRVVREPAASPAVSTDSTPRPDPGTELMRAIVSEAARQQQAQQEQQYERFKNGMDNMRVCMSCGGSGYYRYVDGSGNLIMNACPKCGGSGKNW